MAQWAESPSPRARMNTSTDNETSVYDTPNSTLVMDGTIEDSINMNTSLIQAEQGMWYYKALFVEMEKIQASSCKLYLVVLLFPY